MPTVLEDDRPTTAPEAARRSVPLATAPVGPGPRPVSEAPAMPPLDPRTYDRGLGCVHCGLCLPTCPTYAETGHEADGPRGRIATMLALSDGRLNATDEAVRHLDLCLDCRACETACPSGVVYHELIEEARSKLDKLKPPGAESRLMRGLFFHVLTRSGRLKAAVLPARLLQKAGVYGLLRKSGAFKLLPEGLRKMERMLPADGPLWPRHLPERLPALAPDGSRLDKPKLTVGLLAGCVGSVMFEKVNRQAAELLAASGAEVVTPRSQACCGAIHHHAGDEGHARELARKNLDAFAGCDVVCTTIAGCGAMLRDYGHLLRDDPDYADKAEGFAARVRDVTEVLVDPALALPPMKHAVERRVTYHDACHLAHAQRVTAPPRRLLATVPGLTLVPLAESDMCCGAAGTYNLTQPAMATRLAERKLSHIADTGATHCATGNVGCAMHLQGEADATGRPLTLVHPVEILHESAFGPDSKPRLNPSSPSSR